jgi:hypothetical protein
MVDNEFIKFPGTEEARLSNTGETPTLPLRSKAVGGLFFSGGVTIIQV